MTKTTKFKGYTVTATPTTWTDGTPATRITCDCGTSHPGAAVVHAATVDPKLIHGNVTMAWSPIGRGSRTVRRDA